MAFWNTVGGYAKSAWANPVARHAMIGAGAGAAYGGMFGNGWGSVAGGAAFGAAGGAAWGQWGAGRGYLGKGASWLGSRQMFPASSVNKWYGGALGAMGSGLDYIATNRHGDKVLAGLGIASAAHTGSTVLSSNRGY